MKLPYRWVRRVLLWPLPIIATFFYLATVPLLIIGALLISYRLPGKLRALRALGLATVYLFVEAAVMVAGLALWIVSAFGANTPPGFFVAAHYVLLRWALKVLIGSGRRLFSLEITVAGEPLPTHDAVADFDDAPLIVMARHAGPADSLLLLNQVMSWHGRRPRIVAKDILQLDPAFDLLLNRLPNRFISAAGGHNAVDAIAELAAGMDGRDAFVIFPEGGNFTESRRLRAIDRLRTHGDVDAAERAERLRNVLPPRPAGSIAAMNACPSADAVFVAHTGLDAIAGVGDVWLALPEVNTLELSWRHIDALDLPADDAGKEEMLLRAWEAIDAWIVEHRPGAGEVVDAESNVE
ncbi:MAG: 1-acyl-sn-glycerol-3-phosphate acyltransferase [Ilumatobacter sp.]